MSGRTVQQSSRTDASGTHREGAGPYSHDFEPAFRPEEYIELHNLGYVHQVRAVAPIPAVDVTLSVTSNGTNADQELPELEMEEGMIAQWRLLDSSDIRDGTNIQMDQQGQQSVMYSTKNQRGHVDTNTGDLAGESVMTELYQYEKTDLHATVVESGGDGSDLTLTFSGWAFRLGDELSSAPDGVRPWVVTDGPVDP